jgi:hypothetical protein
MRSYRSKARFELDRTFILYLLNLFGLFLVSIGYPLWRHFQIAGNLDIGSHFRRYGRDTPLHFAGEELCIPWACIVFPVVLAQYAIVLRGWDFIKRKGTAFGMMFDAPVIGPILATGYFILPVALYFYGLDSVFRLIIGPVEVLPQANLSLFAKEAINEANQCVRVFAIIGALSVAFWLFEKLRVKLKRS